MFRRIPQNPQTWNASQNVETPYSTTINSARTILWKMNYDTKTPDKEIKKLLKYNFQNLYKFFPRTVEEPSPEQNCGRKRSINLHFKVVDVRPNKRKNIKIFLRTI